MTTANSPLAAPVEYDQAAGIHRARYDWSSPVPLTTALVEVLAEVEEVDSRDVGRLYEAVDPEALDALFAPVPGAAARAAGRVSFAVDDHVVTVEGDGTVEVREPSGAD